jgi:hypothetical protein
MTLRRCLGVALAALAAAAPGCGIGPGEASEGEATLTVTRDYGAERMLEASQADPPAAETVIRFLDREAEITTRYGGGFVQSIDGVSGELTGGRSFDWFFYVNGIEADRGGADVDVRGGDRIWWDHRDWTDAMRVPAVVGSFPEPFLQASTPAEDRNPVAVRCMGTAAACDEVRSRLEDEGIELADGDDSPRVLVGPWARVRVDPVAAKLEEGPQASGVFARFERLAGAWSLVELESDAEPLARLPEGAGLVAALKPGEDPATWVVTGTDPAGVDAAVELLGDDLADRYAVAADGSGAAIPLPAKLP